MYILFTQRVRELGVTRSYTTTNLFSTQLSSKKRLCVYNYIYIQVEIWKWSVVALENCIALYSTSVCVCTMGWLQTLAKPQSHIITSASSSNSKVLDSIATFPYSLPGVVVVSIIIHKFTYTYIQRFLFPLKCL